MKRQHAIAVAAFAAAGILGGCATPGYYNQPIISQPASQPYPTSRPAYPANPTYPPASSQSYYSGYGVIDSIQRAEAGNGNVNGGVGGAGAVVGGIVGGLLGHQVGGGSGKTAATVAGAIGGAMVGSQIEQRSGVPLQETYRIGVRLDNGSYQTIVQDSVADLQIGSRVRIENDRVYRY